MTEVSRESQVEALVAELARIPDWTRTFTVPADEAWRRYRLPEELLTCLADAGLPSRRQALGACFDSNDLLNASVHLGTSPASRTTRRFWSAALNRPPEVTAVTYRISYQASCPDAKHSPPCRYHFAVPGGSRIRHKVSPGQPAPPPHAQVRLATSWPQLPEEICETLEEARDLRFMWLPALLATDLGFIRATGLADCIGVARLLIRESRRRGQIARHSYGLAVAPPFSVPHYWAEFRVSGRWVPVDPVLIRAMVSWGVLRAGEWHPNRSLGAILARVASHRIALATHDGQRVPVSIPTEQVAVETL